MIQEPELNNHRHYPHHDRSDWTHSAHRQIARLLNEGADTLDTLSPEKLVRYMQDFTGRSPTPEELPEVLPHACYVLNVWRQLNHRPLLCDYLQNNITA